MVEEDYIKGLEDLAELRLSMFVKERELRFIAEARAERIEQVLAGYRTEQIIAAQKQAEAHV